MDANQPYDDGLDHDAEMLDAETRLRCSSVQQRQAGKDTGAQMALCGLQQRATKMV